MEYEILKYLLEIKFKILIAFCNLDMTGRV
jgi:hypothetical protein